MVEWYHTLSYRGVLRGVDILITSPICNSKLMNPQKTPKTEIKKHYPKVLKFNKSGGVFLRYLPPFFPISNSYKNGGTHKYTA